MAGTDKGERAEAGESLTEKTPRFLFVGPSSAAAAGAATITKAALREGGKAADVTLVTRRDPETFAPTTEGLGSVFATDNIETGFFGQTDDSPDSMEPPTKVFIFPVGETDEEGRAIADRARGLCEEHDVEFMVVPTSIEAMVVSDVLGRVATASETEPSNI